MNVSRVVDHRRMVGKGDEGFPSGRRREFAGQDYNRFAFGDQVRDPSADSSRLRVRGPKIVRVQGMPGRLLRTAVSRGFSGGVLLSRGRATSPSIVVIVDGEFSDRLSRRRGFCTAGERARSVDAPVFEARLAGVGRRGGRVSRRRGLESVDDPEFRSDERTGIPGTASASRSLSFVPAPIGRSRRSESGIPRPPVCRRPDDIGVERFQTVGCCGDDVILTRCVVVR